MINLETSVTRSADFAPGKAVHYRMSPQNLPCVTALRPDACALANNHVLDFGCTGLAETLGACRRRGCRLWEPDLTPPARGSPRSSRCPEAAVP